MTTENWLSIAGVLIAIILGIWALWRFRLKSDPPPSNKILQEGWQHYFTPTTLDPPGTVFRIDSAKRKYHVCQLPVKPVVGDEAFGEHTESITVSLGVVARIFGIKADPAASKTERLQFSLEGAQREVTSDEAVRAELVNAFRNVDYRNNNRYFVIRESLKATGITHILTRNQIQSLGGEAVLTPQVGLTGSLHKSDRGHEYRLQKSFAAAMRIMFLPEEIVPAALPKPTLPRPSEEPTYRGRGARPHSVGGEILGGASPEASRFSLIRVKESLVWEEGDSKAT
jgi:hypothetical protein